MEIYVKSYTITQKRMLMAVKKKKLIFYILK